MNKDNKTLTPMEEEARLRNNAMKRRVARQQSHLDMADLEGLPMPAITGIKARVNKRDNKFKRRGASFDRTWKNETKARAQWARHKEGPCRCYTESEKKDDSLLVRLRRDGFPVVL